ncbi:MAG: Fe-S-containing protein [Patescibacteria group bacterium]
MSKNKNITNYQREKYWMIIVVVVVVLIIGGFFLLRKPEEKNISQSQCQFKEMTFYYRDSCSWCQKVKKEETIKKIKELGVNVKEISTDIGPIKHQFQGVPTFVIDEKVYSGYKTFEELKELLVCPTNSKQGLETQNQTPSVVQTEKAFFGEKGEKVVLENGEVKLEASQFNDNQARFYNVALPDSKIIYFFVVKDKNGIYRAAANACAVCFKTYKGFRQEGNEIVCNNCGNRYPIEKIATEKGGCNPGPINPNLSTQNSQIIIEQSDIEQVADLF